MNPEKENQVDKKIMDEAIEGYRENKYNSAKIRGMVILIALICFLIFAIWIY